MSGIFGGSKGNFGASALSGMAFQSSAYGNPVPILYGTNRLNANLIDYDWFQAIPQTTKIGGFLGMGGGRVTTGYAYYAATLLGLCEGPVASVARVWNDQNVTTAALAAPNGLTLLTGSRPQSAWSWWSTNIPAKALPYSGTAILAANSLPLPGGSMGNWAFEITGLLATEADTTSKILIGTGTGSLTTFALLDCNGVAVTSMAAYPAWVAYVNTTQTAATLALVGGVYKITFATAPANGALIYWVGNSIIVNDAKPYAVITDYLTNADYGAGVPSGNIADLTQGGAAGAYSTYCQAMGFKIAPILKDAKSAAEHLRDILDATNSEAIRTPNSSGTMQIQVIPYGDVAITANSTTFTPVLTIQAALTDDDFLGVIDVSGAPTGTDPIQISRVSPGDTFNTVPVSFNDRMAGYNTSTLSIPEPTDAAINGTRKTGAKVLPLIVLRTHAQTISAIMGQAQVFKKNRFKFLAGWRFSRLEPMDYITLQSNIMGLPTTVVRILSVTWPDEGSEDQGLAFEAESSPIGVGHATVTAPMSSGGTTTNTNIDPGATYTPVIFDVAPLLSISGGPEIAIGATGGTDWGGANVWVSNDNVNFTSAGQITSKATYGVLTAGMLATGGAAVNLTVSLGGLTTITNAQALANGGLCWVAGASGGSGGEMVDFSTATLTSAYNYTLTLPLRGNYGTVAATHANGAAFLSCDGAVLRYAVPASWLGSPVYIKLQAFNRWGAGLQSLASTAAVTYTPTSQGVYGNPDGNPTTTLTGMNSDDILSRSEKPDLINRYNQLVAVQGTISTVGSLDYQANALGVSHTAFDTAVTALYTWLQALVPSWTNLLLDTPLGTGGGAYLRGLWVTIATTQQALMAAIQSASLSSAVSTSLASLNVMGLKSPSTAAWAYASKPVLPNGTYPAGSCWLTTDGKEVQVNADGTVWEDVIVAATGLFGKLVTSQLVVANWDNLIANPNCQTTNAPSGSYEAAGMANIGVYAISPNGWCRAVTVTGAGSSWTAVGSCPCNPGDAFYFGANGQYNGTGTGAGSLQIQFLDKSGADVGDFYSASLVSGAGLAPLVISGATAPATAQNVVFYMRLQGTTASSTILLNQFYARRCMDASVAVDGFFTAQSAAVAQFIRSTNYTSGALGQAPVGFKLGGSTFPCTDILGNAFNAQLELGGAINLQGYQLNQLGVAKLFFGTNGNVAYTSGTTVWTAPVMGAVGTTYKVLVTVQGGGASGMGGSTSCNGGGAGAHCSFELLVRDGTTLTCVVGAGGAASGSSTMNAGGNSTVTLGGSLPSGGLSAGLLMTCTGGGNNTWGGNVNAGSGPMAGFVGEVGGAPGIGQNGWAGGPFINFLAGGPGGGVAGGTQTGGNSAGWQGGTFSGTVAGGGASPYGPGGAGNSSGVGVTPATWAYGAGGGGGLTTSGAGIGGIITIQIL